MKLTMTILNHITTHDIIRRVQLADNYKDWSRASEVEER